MGVAAPAGVTKAYYFAYPIGLFVSFGTYWAANWISPPALSFPLKEWHEPVDYIRPEERGEVLGGRVADVETDSGAGEKDVGEKSVRVGAVRSLSL